MNIIKGFRFRPTDVELIEYLQDKTFDRDSLVQVIALVPDICQLDPWQLPELSILQTGDGLWYFMYPPKYKYRNSKRISRTTPKGYWKPTGNARKIINGDTGEEIGSKKTLVFYEGQCHDKNKNKTCWVMHEYELKADALVATTSDQKIVNLCKLKKKVDISSGEAGQSSQHTLSNLVPHVANNAISEDLLEPNRSIELEPEESNGPCSILTQSSSIGMQAGERSNQHNIPIEPEGSNGHGGVLTQSSSVETQAGERSNQHKMVIADEGFNITSHSVNLVAEDAIPRDQLGLKEVSTEGNGSNNNYKIQNLYSRIEQDNESSNSILINDDEKFPTERSNQHNMVDAAKGFEMPYSFEYSAHDEDLIPTWLLYYDGISLKELLADEPNAANDTNRIQDQFLANEGEGEFLNSITANTNEDYLQEGNRQHYLAADDEGSCLPSMDLMESSNSMGKSRKRPRLEDDESSHRGEIGETQPWGTRYTL